MYVIYINYKYSDSVIGIKETSQERVSYAIILHTVVIDGVMIGK